MTKTFRAPGRTELGGNHTDHQHGRVLAAGIDLYITAQAEKTDYRIVRIASEGYPELVVNLSILEPIEAEKNTSAALVRGIAARIKQLGYEPGGFNARMRSDVLSGSGLSSSAAYEVLIGRIFNDFYCGGELTDVQIAQIGQYAENVYFGKPCGLMDQMACSVGNIVAIDFKDPDHPVIEQIDRRFEDYGYALCIIDTHTEHADLTDDYASIPKDMQKVAEYYGKEVLRDVPEDEFKECILCAGAVLTNLQVKRALHFFAENDRAGKLAEALKAGNFEEYLRLVNESGRSSEELLQNIVPQ
ncbi:MAG: galactokinase, partial [Firmicutes bacterium]|nr:galactokinase [Bacillota bacterium]